MVESINVDSEMSKILIVDDNDDLRTIMKIMLREFEVVEAKNGKEAIELFNESKPDLVLMDILMPVMDGIEATEIIMEKDPDAVVVAITAYSSRAPEILNAGAKEVLKKPLRKEKLISKIKNHLK